MVSEDQRNEIIARVVAALSAQASVHAIWLEGSAASGQVDAFSDIDLWADVDAGSEAGAFSAIREGLRTLGPLGLEHTPDHPHPQIRQRFYRPAGASPYLFLDVCLQQHGRGTVLPAFEPFKVLYDPGSIVRAEAVQDMRDTVLQRLAVLQAAWWRRLLVLKEVERGRLLEALGYYQHLVLEPLTELLRLCYCPEKHDYGLKHLYRDLPADAVGELEALYTVTTLADLPASVGRADARFTELVRELA